MASKRARKLALKMADAHMERVGVVNKAAGMAAFQREDLAAQFLPSAVAVDDMVRRFAQALKRSVREMAEHREHIGRLVDENGARINMLAQRYSEYSGRAVAGVSEVEKGWRDFDLARFSVGLVENREPLKMNGHNRGQGVAPEPPPLWHPEADEGSL